MTIDPNISPDGSEIRRKGEKYPRRDHDDLATIADWVALHGEVEVANI